MAKVGVDEWLRTLLNNYFAAYSKNWGANVTDDFARIVGRPPRGIDDFARDFAGAFGNAAPPQSQPQAAGAATRT